MTPDEEQEWEQARGGDRAALDLLLRRHERSVYRFGLRMCGDEEAAREVLQRTLLAAFEQLASFRGEARLSTWLYSLARSQCSRLHRRTRSAPLHDLALDAPGAAPELASEAPGPDEQTQQAEMSRLVAAAISLLPEAQREAVVLKDVEDLSLEEAAGILRLAIPAFKSRLHRAREQLKTNLAVLLREQAQSPRRPLCERLQAALRQAHGEAIDQAACRTIEVHLAICESCARRLGSLRNAAALCRRLPGGQVPEPVQRAVRAALADALGQ
jgi:RNA polymerase sigma-70 factor (ECF subfamily)